MRQCSFTFRMFNFILYIQTEKLTLKPSQMIVNEASYDDSWLQTSPLPTTMRVNWSKTSQKILIGNDEFTFGDVSDLRQLFREMTFQLFASITDAWQT